MPAQRLARLEESATLAMAKRARELKAQGIDVISLALGEPDFDTPVHIKNAGVESIRANFTHYPPVAGIPELRQAVARHLNEVFGLEYAPEDVVVSAGAKQSLYNIFMSLLNPGDEAVLIAPYWVSYHSQIELAGGTPVVVDASANPTGKVQPEQLEAALGPNTRLVVFNSPVNPTGLTYTENEWEALADVLRRHPQVWVVCDEIYALLHYKGPAPSLARLPGLFERCIVVTGVAKSFAMTGWRIGLAAGPRAIMQCCEKMQGQVTSGACSIAQKAAAEAFSANLASVHRMRTEFARRAQKAQQWLQQYIPEWTFVPPTGAFYIYADVRAHLGRTPPGGQALTTPEHLALFLLAQAHVATVPGEAFGTRHHLRLSFSVGPDDLHTAIRRMSEALATLK